MERHNSWDNLSQKDIASPCRSVTSLLQTSRTNLSPYHTSSQFFNILDSRKCMDGNRNDELPDWMKDLKRQEELLSQKRRAIVEKTGTNVPRRLNQTEPSVTDFKNIQDAVNNTLEAPRETYPSTIRPISERFPATTQMDVVEMHFNKHVMQYERGTLKEIDVNEDNLMSNHKPFDINKVEPNEYTNMNGFILDKAHEAAQELNNIPSHQACRSRDEGTATQSEHVENSQSVLDKGCTCSIPCKGSCKCLQGCVTVSDEEKNRERFITTEMHENNTQRGDEGLAVKETLLQENKTQREYDTACLQSSEQLLETISTLSEALPEHKIEKADKERLFDETMKVVASMKTTLTDCVRALKNIDDTTASYKESMKHVKEKKIKNRDAIEKHIKQVEQLLFNDAIFEPTFCVINDLIEEVEKQNDLVQNQLTHLQNDVTRETGKPCNTLVLKESGRDLQNYRTQAQEDHFYAQKHVEELVERLKQQNIPKCIGFRDYQGKRNPKKQTQKCVSYPNITHSFHKNITEQFSTSSSNSSSCSSKKKTSYKKRQPSQLNIVYSPSPSLYEQEQFETKVDGTRMANNLTSSDSSHSLTHAQRPYSLTVESLNIPSSIVSVSSPKQQDQISETEDPLQKEDFLREQCIGERKISDQLFGEIKRVEVSLEKKKIREQSLTEPNMQEGPLEDLKLKEQYLIEQSQKENFPKQAPLEDTSCTKNNSRRQSETEDCASFHETSSTSSRPSLQGEQHETLCPKLNEKQQTFESSVPMVRSTSSCCVAGKSAADLFQDVEDEFDSLFTNY